MLRSSCFRDVVGGSPSRHVVAEISLTPTPDARPAACRSGRDGDMMHDMRPIYGIDRFLPIIGS